MKNSTLERDFVSPPAKWRGKPFWSWNGELRASELIRQVGIMKEMGFGGYFMHSRSGLITEYLGKDWFDCINATAKAGIACDMENWLYDEDRWPSGSAGGMVTKDTRYRAKSLRLYQMRPEQYTNTEEELCAFYADLDGVTMHSYRRYLPDASLPIPIGTWHVLSFRVCPDQPESVFNGTTYIDTMNEAAVAEFIRLTHMKYAEKCDAEVFDSVKGIFTDEPHRGHGMDNRKEKNGVVTCDICYTDDFLDRFREAYGYDAEAVLPELFYQPGGARVAPIKLHWFDLACNLFDLRFAKQIQDACHDLGIAFTGHVLHEDQLDHQTVSNGSLMRFYQYMDVPGVDVLSEGAFNPRIVKQVSSVARQMGKKQILSELYGCTGWQMNLRSHKEVGDWQAILGINLRCHHLSWYTMEGEAKRDYPASIAHQSAWYRDYDAVEQYFARFGRIMAEGDAICDLLVLSPIESVWCQTYLGWANWLNATEPEIHKLNHHYSTLSDMLLHAHIDYDYGEEQMLGQMASVEKDEDGSTVLCVGQARYHTVLISGLLTIRPSTLDLLTDFRRAGGCVIFAGAPPLYVDARPSALPAKLAGQSICLPFASAHLIPALREAVIEGATLKTADGADAETVLMQMRRADDGVTVAMVNTDRTRETGDMTLTLPIHDAYHLEIWNMETGAIENVDHALYYSAGKAKVKLHLAASESRIYRFVSALSPRAVRTPTLKTICETEIKGAFHYRLHEDNVLVLDYAKVRIDDGEWSEKDEILRLDDLVRDTLGIERRSGEMIQPWYSKRYDNDVLAQVDVSYRFTIDDMPTSPVTLAAERPFENDYAINGVPLTPSGIDDFWVDDAFKKLPVPLGALRLGENEITVHIAFRKTSNLEAVYLLGAFGVRAEAKQARVISLPPVLDLNQNLDVQGLPFYGAEITYLIPHDTIAPHIKKDCRVQVAFSKNPLGLLRVTCGEAASRVLWEPYTADITRGVTEGCELEITAVHTRRNTFGPLHQLPAIAGSYGPFSFRSSGRHWSDDYVFIDSAIPYLAIRCLKED